jgi:tetratricopeptide (TPR) repeat protein
MANTPPTDNAGQSSLPTFSPADIARAQECFRRAQELVNGKNYDYAIELYIQGLRYWPEAVDEGHKPCRAASLFRGKVKIGFGDKMKYKTNAKDPREAMVNAEMLLAKDPQNIGFMEELLKSADKAALPLTTLWIGELYADAAIRETKPSPARFQLLRDVYERLSDRVKGFDVDMAIEAMKRAAEDILPKLKSLKPSDATVANDLRDMGARLTSLRGRYDRDEGNFTGSIANRDSQKEIYDKDRVVQTDDRMDELITLAQNRYEVNPKDQRLLNDLVELLCRREREEDEKKAISILIQAHKESGEYRYKSKACDIRMKQNRRAVRNVEKSGDPEKLKQAEKDALGFEMQVYKDRIKHYPTDMRLRFEYGKRLFDAGRYDDAIPFLQEARADRKVRFQCSLYVGQCFYEKAYYAQAIDTFREAIGSYEIPDDDLGKELQYWLGRSCEADKRTEDALKIYGQLIRLDYNYRKGDVRKRIDDLHASR